jgi:2-keto-3-deoxy-L-rhamnonate aldolase RhmA
VDAIESIVAAEGVDAVIFGWGDYSVEVGFDADRCGDAAVRVYEACREAGVGAALTGGQDFYAGCFRIAGVDSLIMSAALGAAVERARAAFAYPPVQ